MVTIFYNITDGDIQTIQDYITERIKQQPEMKPMPYEDFIIHLITEWSANGIKGTTSLIKQNTFTQKEFDNEPCPEYKYNDKKMGKKQAVMFSNPVVMVGLMSLFKYNNILLKKNNKEPFNSIDHMIHSLINEQIIAMRNQLIDLQFKAEAENAIKLSKVVKQIKS